MDGEENRGGENKQMNMGDGWMENKIGEVKANKYINLESEAGLLIGI